MAPNPKLVIVRDRNWLDELRSRRCLITGQCGHSEETVDPVHIGTTGKGTSSKCSDDECIPLLHRFHAQGHDKGEISNLRKLLPDSVMDKALSLFAAWYGYERTRENATNAELKDALRLYGKWLYQEWKNK